MVLHLVFIKAIETRVSERLEALHRALEQGHHVALHFHVTHEHDFHLVFHPHVGIGQSEIEDLSGQGNGQITGHPECRTHPSGKRISCCP